MLLEEEGKRDGGRWERREGKGQESERDRWNTEEKRGT